MFSLSKVKYIVKKDLKSYFGSPQSFISIAAFICVIGYVFFQLIFQFNFIVDQSEYIPTQSKGLNLKVVKPLYRTVEVVFLFLIPVFTMNSICGEKNENTFEKLVSNLSNATELGVAKIISSFLITFFHLVSTSVFLALLVIYADPEVGPLFSGFLALCLYSLAFVSLGVFISSLFASNMIAALSTFATLLLFYIIDAPIDRLSEPYAGLLENFSPQFHTERMLNGYLHSSDLVYFISIFGLGVYFTICNLANFKNR